MSDLDELRRVISLYGPLLDDRRFEDWAQLFAEDAEWISVPGLHRPGGGNAGGNAGGNPQTWTVRGRDQIVAQVRNATEPLQGDGARRMHFSGPPIIDVDGDRANAWWDFILVHITQGAMSINTSGRYYARLAKQGGRWRFTQRVSVQHGAALPPGLTRLPGA